MRRTLFAVLASVLFILWIDPASAMLQLHQHSHSIRCLSPPSSSQLYSGNFANRMSRFGGRIPEEDQPQQELSWDYYDDDDALNNDDMFGEPQGADKATPGTQNNEDELPLQDIEGAEITEAFKERVKASHFDEKEESSQGGSKFRQLMSRATQSAASVVPELQQQQPQQQQSLQLPNNPLDLSIEEQAALFRELMMERQQQQQQQQQMTLYDTTQQQMQPHPYQSSPNGPENKYREYGTGYDGRKIGRNREADAVSNAADVYFAQLKRDSTSRNYARYSGDDQKANEVFWDPAIDQIEAPANPYTKEYRERERNMLETVPEEMLVFQEYGEQQEESAPRQSYRDRLAQAQAQRQQSQQSQQDTWQQQTQDVPQQQQKWQETQDVQQQQQNWQPQQQQEQATPPQQWSPQGWQPQQQQEQNDVPGNPPPFDLY